MRNANRVAEGGLRHKYSLLANKYQVHTWLFLTLAEKKTIFGF